MEGGPAGRQESINPISRLIQIQQAKKEKEPVYSLVAERGMPRRREFVMQVSEETYVLHVWYVHVGCLFIAYLMVVKVGSLIISLFLRLSVVQ